MHSWRPHSSISGSNHPDQFPVPDEADQCNTVYSMADISGTGASTSGATSMAYLPQMVVLSELRHEAFETCVPSGPSESGLVSKWRPKDRMKTGCVALVLCLNISVDPPDVIKISPCARMECWIDPFSMAAPKALETIGKSLESQYERWQPKARYKLQLDPTVDEVKKLCQSCRKYARSDRVLFHYNGHGVPKPTVNGEIWVFNKSYTQYIPLPVSDLDSWLKTPSIYVFDCSAAGMIISAFTEKHDSSSRDCILLAACEAHESLPQSAEFPGDVFTSCLTTPIKMALRWFCSRSLLCSSLDHTLIDKIPGRQNDRKTLLGELNWIFTAVTDTIAWNVLPHDLFLRLFRQDLLVASLFRNFLLAERIMRTANCSPVSFPVLPSTHQHHMWDAWDMAAEICLSQIQQSSDDPGAEFQASPFFTEQLTAFEVWLDHGSELKKPPEQLPIVLQALLSQSLRFRALVLLGRFLDMGPWAVDLALSVGIFPYVYKLLQTTALELRQILVFIWTKILALDKSCQVDLVKEDKGYMYFIKFLDSTDAYPEQRAMAAFVLAVVVDSHRRGQEACVSGNLIHVCLRHLQFITPNDSVPEPLLLQWLCLCLGKVWEDFPEAQMIGIHADAHTIFARLLHEPQPEVRASAIFSLGTLLEVVGADNFPEGSGGDDDTDDDEKASSELKIVRSLLEAVADGSPLVRVEVAVALARFAFGHNKPLKSVALARLKPQSATMISSSPLLAGVRSQSNGACMIQSHSLQQACAVLPSHLSSATRVGSEGISASCREGERVSSSPQVSPGMMHGSPLSDDFSQCSDSGGAHQRNGSSNGIINFSTSRPLDTALYTQCLHAMCNLAKDPSPRVAGLGKRILSIIGVEHVTKVSRSGRQGDTPSASPHSGLSGFARSSSWFDMSAGHSSLTFRTPPISPPRESYLTGLRRVCSLEFRPHQLNSPDSELGNPLLGSSGLPIPTLERSLLPQSTIYNWSCGHFSKPLLTALDENDDALARREDRERVALDLIFKCQHSAVGKLSNQIAGWDTKFETGTKAVLLHPFLPVVIAADENECIRLWNYEEAAFLNGFENHKFLEKGITKLCFVNELDDCMLLVASCDGNVRIWKNITERSGQQLVTALSSTHGRRPGVRNMNAVVDWQQQSGYLFASGDLSSIMLWDLDKEQLIYSFPSSSSSDCHITVLSASQVNGGQFAAGFLDGSVRLYDLRTSDLLVCTRRPHPKTARVVGIGFQPGLDPGKVVTASQAGDIQFLDMRNERDAYMTIDAHRGSLTALAVHRHAPVIASGSSKHAIKIFSLLGEQLRLIKYYPTFMAQKIGLVSCLTFHPYSVVLAAGAADACVSIYADDGVQIR